MKKYFPLLLAFLFIPFSATTKEVPKVKIKQIRKWYKEVEASLKKCILIEMNDYGDEKIYNGYTPEIKAYYNTLAKQFIKIVHYGGRDGWEQTINFYLQNGQLFFIYTTGSYYEKMYTAKELGMTNQKLWEMGGAAKTLKFYEYRTYIFKGKVIRYLTKEKEVQASDKDHSLKGVKNTKSNIRQELVDQDIAYLKRILSALMKKL